MGLLNMKIKAPISIGHKRKLKMYQKSLGASLSQLKANCLNSDAKPKTIPEPREKNFGKTHKHSKRLTLKHTIKQVMRTTNNWN